MSTHAFAEIQRRAAARLQRSSSDWDAAEPSNGVDVRAQLSANAAFKARMIAQRKAREAEAPPDTLAIAAQGVQGSAQSLPHLDVIQRAFGRHDVTGVQAFVGGTAKAASEAIGAEAYATGNCVAFRESPSLHTAAHEAAHVVQQRAGVSLQGGVGAVGDQYEQHADRVADAVVRGESAEGLLDEFAGGGAGSGVQMRPMYPTGHRTQQVPRRRVGTFRYTVVAADDPPGTKVPRFPLPKITIEARSVQGWRTFLANRAGETLGSLELVVFMARALNMKNLKAYEDPHHLAQAAAGRMGQPFGLGDDARSMHSRSMTHGLNGFAGLTRISELEAMALMEALLTVGSSIDLADHESVPALVDAATGPLLAAFTSRFSAKTLARRVARREGTMTDTEMGAIDAFAEDASDMKDVADRHAGRSTLDPIRQLVASAFGMALAGVGQVMEGKAEGRYLVREGGLTIYTALERMEADAKADSSLFSSTWAHAIGAAAPLLPRTLSTLLKTFGPVARRLFGYCSSGDAKRISLRLRSDFRQHIEALVRSSALRMENGLVSDFSDAMGGG